MLDCCLIENIISGFPFVHSTSGFNQESNGVVTGNITILFDSLREGLNFSLKILPQYPYGSYESESITFYNANLIGYGHVMGDGSICIHTSHSPSLRKKLSIDFTSLKSWIEKYYTNKEKDSHYEHIITGEHTFIEKYISFTFTDIEYKFSDIEHGKVNYSKLSNSIYKNKDIYNFIINSFITKDSTYYCNWSKSYRESLNTNRGLYCFIKKHPANNNFAFSLWSEFESIFPQDFLDHINNHDFKGQPFLPVFIGYETSKDKIHWQIALLEENNLPIEKEFCLNGALYLPKWKLKDDKICWAISSNSSYELFYGRGKLSEHITNRKILIIGTGAIGSIVSKILVRGGTINISLADYDTKEYGNICRSEYLFNNGLGDKVEELASILTTTSPFVDIKIVTDDFFETGIKTYHSTPNERVLFESFLNSYDIIFDCTTDNDLMYVLDQLSLNCDLINLSITNHARDLVCAFHPNIYHPVNLLFSEILKNKTDDLYEPTGCWSPTFKASYNDINMLASCAMNKINRIYSQKDQKSNFIISSEEDQLSIKIKEI